MADDMASGVDFSAMQRPGSSTKSESYAIVYCNSTKMSISPWDVRITVGALVESGVSEMVNEDRLTLVMSPQHAKAVLDSLATTVRLYEESFGTIPDVQAIIKEGIGPKADEQPQATTASTAPKVRRRAPR